ncbi:MAG: neutral zinc metallopeptidase, partial [Actinomycetota bacterium]|nr:neutral zinc metallopeptidase [Actinomycetota bacterium]
MLVLVAALVLAPTATAAPAAPGGATKVIGATDSVIDQLAVSAVDAVQDYWRRTMPASFGRPWRELRGGFYAVDTTKPNGRLPGCISHVEELVDQAVYCPASDAVAWDSGHLLPEIQRRFGDAAVVVVIAHEIGHAVHYRLGLAQAIASEPQRWPTILVEAVADCFTGAAMSDIRARSAAALRIDRKQLDNALRALITFRDPVGTAASEENAHGNAFDRVSAFQDGYRHGAAACAAMTIDNRVFTERRFGSSDDAARAGNLPIDQLLESVSTDAGSWYGQLVASRGGQAWRAPALVVEPAPACPAAGDQGPVQFCATTGAVTADVAALRPLVDSIGDYAGGMLLASRYGLAALGALQEPVEGATAGRRALCLAGAYSASLFDRQDGFT